MVNIPFIEGPAVGNDTGMSEYIILFKDLEMDLERYIKWKEQIKKVPYNIYFDQNKKKTK